MYKREREKKGPSRPGSARKGSSWKLGSSLKFLDELLLGPQKNSTILTELSSSLKFRLANNPTQTSKMPLLQYWQSYKDEISFIAGLNSTSYDMSWRQSHS